MTTFSSTRSRRRLIRRGAAVIGALALVATFGSMTAYASHAEVSLTGSNFEIDTDANIKVDDASPSIDWASVTEIRKQDTASGSNDESFGNGAKEDSTSPGVGTGGIPPNKSDLKYFGMYQEGDTASGFLNLYWARVQDPSGTTNMDFELNKLRCNPSATPPAPTNCSGNGTTPIRSVGDALVIYDLSQGGTNPTLSIRRWSGSAWGTPTDLTSASDATGSINTSAIAAADADGLGALGARTFGEAQLKLSSLFSGASGCSSFGSAYLKSRSSDTFSSALKDFVPPQAVNISNCGSVQVTKTDDASTPLAGAVFTLYKDLAPTGAPRTAADTITSLTCTTVAGACTISNVPFGPYWVVETTTPTGYETAADQLISVSTTTAVPVSFVDNRQRGAIKVTKTRKHAASGSGDYPQAGVDFTINGVTKATDANGVACFDGLLPASYTVHETVPTGYHVVANDKSVTVDNAAACSDATYVGETVSFRNVPLTNLTVSVNSQVDGGTGSTISCTDAADASIAAGTVLAASPANGDGSASATDLEPGTYTCTVVIDP